jgi:hypothetical protein
MRRNSMDLIDRQAAIKTLEKGLPSEPLKSKYTEGITVGFGLAITWIEQLPAVETEVLKCKDCYWWTKQSDSLQGRCDRYGFYPTGYWYCAAARERRTDDQT